MKQTIYTCEGDGCKAVKKDTNHWFSVVVKPALIQIFHSQALLDAPEEVKHFCGERCMMNFVSREIYPTQLEKTA